MSDSLKYKLMLILETIVRKILLIVIINYSLTKTTINIMDYPVLIYHMLTALIIAVQISLLAVVHRV
jgi:hypothetical protein